MSVAGKESQEEEEVETKLREFSPVLSIPVFFLSRQIGLHKYQGEIDLHGSQYCPKVLL